MKLRNILATHRRLAMKLAELERKLSTHDQQIVVLFDANHELHHYLVNGVSVEYLRGDGTIGYEPIRVVDFGDPRQNDWLVANQFTIAEGGHTRRPDVVVFVNGIPRGDRAKERRR